MIDAVLLTLDPVINFLRLFRRRAAKKWPLRGSLKRAAGCL
jgi:hypothetical protein